MHKIVFIFLLLYLNLLATNYDALLFHANCTTCHFETKSVSTPSVIEFRARYRSAFSDKKDFVDYMAKWVHQPKEETSLMPDAVEEYGLMPDLAFDLETLKSISAYIYATDFAQQHEDHTKEHH